MQIIFNKYKYIYLFTLFCASSIAMEMETASSIKLISEEILLKIIDHYLTDCPRLFVAFQRLSKLSLLDKDFNRLAFSLEVQKIIEKRLKYKLKSDVSILDKASLKGNNSDKIINFMLGIDGFHLKILFNMPPTTPLIWIASKGNTQLLQKLEKNKSSNKILDLDNVNFKDDHGKTAFDYAQNDEIKNILLAHGANSKSDSMSACNPVEPAPLILAIKNNQLSEVKNLVQNMKDSNEKNKEIDKALMFAALMGHLETVEYLIENKADVNASNEGASALLVAIMNGHNNIAQLLATHGATLDANALWVAVQHGYFNIVKYLLDRGVSFDCKNLFGSNILHNAAQYGHLDITQYLLEKGVAINQMNDEGFTPLHIAILFGHLDIVKLLIAKGADINAGTNSRTPLMLACQSGNLTMVKFFLEKELSGKTIKKSKLLLHIAAQCGHLEIVKVLLDNKFADVKELDFNDLTSLHTACRHGHLDIVKCLIEAGAKIDCTALSFAKENGHSAIVEILDKTMLKNNN